VSEEQSVTSTENETPEVGPETTTEAPAAEVTEGAVATSARPQTDDKTR